MTLELENKVFIIAEAGVNHNGSLKMAKELIDVAHDAGADAIKFQSFKAATLVSKKASKADYQIKLTGGDESQFSMLKKLEMSEAMHDECVAHCKKTGIQFLSTPFDVESLKLLQKYDLPVYKIASGEITNAPLLLEIARVGKPIILSTGMSTLDDIEKALGVLAFGFSHSEFQPSDLQFKKALESQKGRESLVAKVSLLHCTTEYPAPFDEVNLRALDTMRRVFGLRVGFSDHTEGISIPLAAVACGARIIEKHFTLSRGLPGPDHKASLEPVELKAMVAGIRQVERSLGDGLKSPSPSETKNLLVARKSLVASKSITAGEIFNLDNLTVKRPGTGISPFHFWDYLGKKAPKNYEADEVIQ